MKTIHALTKFAFLCLLAPALVGCASGPKYSQVRSTLPPLPADNGRIYFYRTAVVGAAVQPAVKLNGEKVGIAKAKGFFFVDSPPGNFEVETSTEVKRLLSLTLEEGQTRYVRLNVSMGFFVGHVYPELVETQVGEKEIVKCSYMGKEGGSQARDVH